MSIVPYSTIPAVDFDEEELAEAAKWFVAMLIQHDIDRYSHTQEQIGEQLGGRQKGQVSQLLSGKTGIGLRQWMLIANWQSRPPGEMLDEALTWWRASGRTWSKQHQLTREEKPKRKKRTRDLEKSEGLPRVSSIPPSGHDAHQSATRSIKGRERVRRSNTGKQ